MLHWVRHEPTTAGDSLSSPSPALCFGFVAIHRADSSTSAVDVGDLVGAGQRHGDAEFLLQNVDRLGDAGLAAGARARRHRRGRSCRRARRAPARA